MYFSPAYISSLIVEPLRFFYANYGTQELLWDEDPKISTVEIDTINNYNKLGIQVKPRILISRGGYVISPTGLTDNMAEATSSRNPGIKSEKRFLLVEGMAQVLVESANEGTCEKLVELTENFLSRSGPTIASVQGFKQFAFPLSVSPCTPSKEDAEIFQCTISIPWRKETHYLVKEDGLDFKNFLMTLNANLDSRTMNVNNAFPMITTPSISSANGQLSVGNISVL